MAENWQRAHQELRRLARSRAGLDFEEGRWLLAAWRGGVHTRLGYGSFREYIERLFGYGARLVQEKLRVAEALEGLPMLAQALQTGQTCWSTLRELTRVATPETEAEWLTAAAGRTVRDVEQLVSGHAPGSHPGDPRDASVVRHLLRFEVSGEVLASVREALAKIRRDAGEPLDDDAALLLMARAVLEGPSDPGRSSYQVALTVCESCQQGAMQGNGELVDVGPEVVEMAACDAQHVGRIEGVRTHVGAKTAHENAHVGAKVDHVGVQLQRAVQTIPPAIRRLVLRRDHGRCVVPGCRHATHVDLHHLDTRAEGGQHDPDNLITLCGAHHRALHRGSLIIEGRVSSGITFRHADGSEYGAAVSPVGADVGTKAFQGLRRLGFREGDVRKALGQAAQVVSTRASVEALMRHCLLLLTKRHARAQ
jgi:5-methylcytosine-specific restriction endonuclease McrA